MNIAKVVILVFMVSGCSNKMEDAHLVLAEKKFPVIRDSVYFSAYGGYGYDIILNGKIKIHQPSASGMRGNIGFPSAGDARREAREIIDKLKLKLSPPPVTLKELKEMIAKSREPKLRY